MGTLTARLAEHCAHVHAIEIDRRLEPALERTLAGRDNVTVHSADAMRLDLASLDPAATTFVANLPYHVAAPLVLDSIGGLPAVQRWCVLVQREIATPDCPGMPLYGAPERALRARARGDRPARRVAQRLRARPERRFDARRLRAQARVEGAGRRLAPDRRDRARRLRVPPQDVANALGHGGRRDDRAASRSRCALPASIRRAAEVLPPEPSRAGAGGRLRWSPAPRSTSACASAPGDRRLPRVATVLAALALGDVVELDPAAATCVDAPALPGGDSLVTRALGLLAQRTGHRAGWHVRLGKHVPVGPGSRRSADAAAALALANATLPEPLAPGDCSLLAAEVGSDVPFFVSGLPTALARTRRDARAMPGACSCLGRRGLAGVPLSTAEVYARYEPRANAAERSPRSSPSRSRARDVGSWRHSSRTTSPRRPRRSARRSRLCASGCATDGALVADVSGSGSAVFGLFDSEEAAGAASDRLGGERGVGRRSAG